MKFPYALTVALSLGLCTAEATARTIARTLPAALQLSASDNPAPCSFDFTCTALCGTMFTCPVTSDGISANIEMYVSPATRWNSGDVLRLSGIVRISPEEHHFFSATNAIVVGHVEIPKPTSATGSEIAEGRHDFRYVTVRGVISSIIRDERDERYLWIVLNTMTLPVMAPVEKAVYGFETLASLIDAEVTITGLAIPTTGSRRGLGRQVNIRKKSDLSLVEAPPKDPFDVSELAGSPSMHRQRTSGTVIAVGHDQFFLRTGTKRMITVHPSAGAPLPPAGSHVTVAGFFELDPFHAHLYEALVRDSISSNPPVEETVILTQKLLYDSSLKVKGINTDYHGKILSTCGIATELHREPDGTATFLIRDGDTVVRIDASAFADANIAIPPAGARVSVTGLCLSDCTVSMPIRSFPRLRLYTLIPRTSADIVILQSPAWWTPFRLFVVISILTCVLLGSACWNISLKRKSEKKGRELYRERISHALAEQKVEERTKLAIELHDSISQTLTGIAMQLDIGSSAVAKTMLAACREELRCCLWDLRSRTFEERNMTEVVLRTLAPHVTGSNIDIAVRFNVPLRKFSESVTHAILRIIRELTINAIRHGKPSHVKIAGEYHDRSVSFSVSDDGVGFDASRIPGPTQGHFGLAGIRERLAAFDGTLSIESRPGEGTRCTVSLGTNEEDNGQ